MKLCFISPVKHLKDIGGEEEFLFCLSRQTLEDEEYKKFFKDNGKYVILDNSIHEEERIDDDELVNLAIDMKVNELIIPDVMGYGQKTKELAKVFLDKYYDKLREHNINLVGVIQGRTMSEIANIFREFNNDKRIDYLSLPFDLIPFNFIPERNLNQMFNRLYILQYLTSSYHIKKPIHALGVNTLLEIKLLDAFPLIRSCDSKLMVRLALSNIKIDENNWMHLVKPVRKMDFYDELTKEQIKICNDNIKFLKEQLVRVK